MTCIRYDKNDINDQRAGVPDLCRLSRLCRNALREF